MERVLDVYRRAYDATHRLVCMDQTPRQLIGCTRECIPAAPGRLAREDYEYERLGVCNVFMACQPLAGRRMSKVTARKTKTDWAHFIDDIANQYRQAERITLVMDNLNTHSPAWLYEAFEPERAKASWDRFECHLYAQAWQLAEHGRDRTQRAHRPMPESTHRQHRNFT
jgi:hypothetical protein